MESGSQPGDGIATAPSACGSGSVNYPANVQVCNSQLVTTVDDGGTVSSLGVYPKQPFDFANRTGTITFDVSNDSQGSHAAWPELWVTDQPVPDPFLHESSLQSQPRNGFAIRFAGCTDSSGNANTCPDGSNGLGVDSAAVINNYAVADTFNGTGNLSVIGDQDVLKSGPGQMNRYQVHVSQNRIDVYGTNAYTPGQTVPPLKHISTITGFSLGFTRGLVWLEDAHYNGNKFNTQGTHAFHWDNVGFDGPVLARDLAFDAPDNNAPDNNIAGGGAVGIDASYDVPPNGSFNLTVPGVTGVANAAGALLTFNFYSESVIPLNVSVNGHNVSIAWPYPDQVTYSPRTIAIPVPLADIVTGNNTVTFSAGNYLEQVANVDLIMQGAGGRP